MSSIAYIDTSILVAILFNEVKAKDAYKQINKFKNLVAHHLLISEIFSACKREDLDLTYAGELLNLIDIVYPNTAINEYAQLVLNQGGYIRGADLLHLSCAYWLSTKKPEKVLFASLDMKQNQVAKKVGFQVLA